MDSDSVYDPNFIQVQLGIGDICCVQVLLSYAEFTEMKMSEEDMMALKIPRDQRDYCAHKYLEIQRCKRRHFPLMIKCSNEIHEYHQCNADE